MRVSLPGRYSLERVFDDVCEALPDDIDASIVHLPFDSRGLAPRLRNLAFTARLRADVIHVTGDVQYCALAVRRRRCVLTVLDLESLERLRGLRKQALSLLWFRLPTWWAGRVTTISRATREDLVRHLPSRAAKTTVVPCPVGPAFLQARRPPRRQHPAQVLQIGTAPNKNLERLVDALGPLPVHLRIVGTPTEAQRTLLEASPVPYSLVRNLSEDELIREYLASDVLTFVSTYEGFGLPIVEAQALGLPVITSDRSSMPEVAGDGALLVDPGSTLAIRAAVVRVLESPDLAEELVARGRRNVQSYLPEAVAAGYAEVYRAMARPS